VEPHKNNVPISELRSQIFSSVDFLYHFSMNLTRVHYSDVYATIKGRDIKDADVKLFWSEYVWCVLTSGFKASIATKIHPKIVAIMVPFSPFQRTLVLRHKFRQVLKNDAKFLAILETKSLVETMGWAQFKEKYLEDLETISHLPYMGPALSRHLARNLGINVIKPDVHMWRLAKYFDFESPDVLCDHLHEKYGEKKALIDLALWYTCSTVGTKQLVK